MNEGTKQELINEIQKASQRLAEGTLKSKQRFIEEIKRKHKAVLDKLIAHVKKMA